MKKIKLLLAAMAAMVTMGANAQTAADFADGKYVFQNVGSGRYLGPANSWGTQASLIQFSHYNTLAKLSDGVYSIESQVSNGGTNYYFTGSYMDGPAASVTINEVSDGIYTMSNGTTYYGYDGSSYVLTSNLTDPNSENAQWKIVAYDETYADASEENPVDLTYMIQCPNFDRNHRNRTAWTMEASNQNLGGGDNSNFIAESWRAAFTLSQEVTVPNGYYKLRAQAALTEYDVTGADFPVVYLTSGSTTATVPFNTMQNGENSMAGISAQFTNGNYFTDYTENVLVTSGSITVGVKGTRTNTWCTWDNFQLVYMGLPTDLTAYAEALAAAVAAAEATEGTIPTAAYNAIAAVVTENNKEYDTADDYTAATEAINTAVSTYASSAIVAAYTNYTALRAEVLALDDDATIFTGDATIDVTEADNAVAAATTADDINAAISTLKEIAKTFVTSVTVNEGKYFDVTNFWVVNPTVSENTDGWEKDNVVRPVSWGTGPTTNFGETEFYQSTFDFNQSITLPQGTWEFGVTGFHRAGTYQTYFYAGEDRILLPGESSDVVNSMAQAKTYFDNGNGKVALKFGLEEESNTIKIGIVNNDTETDRWTIFRNFTLKYYGSTVDYSVYTERWEEALAAANAALANTANANVTGSELTALNEAIADAPTAESKKADYNEKINTLVEATAAFTAAASAYDTYAAYRAETVTLFGSDLDVAAPTTAAEAAVAVQNLNIAQYNEVAASYPYSLTSKIGDFSTWTGTATVGADRTADTPNSLDWEHWSGVTHSYYEQCGSGYNNAGGWTIQYEKTTTLPAGSYVVKVAARSSAGVTSSVTCSALPGVEISLPCAGNNTRGINTDGEASWDAEDTFISTGGKNATVGGTGAGWQWRFLPFTLTGETEVTMTFYAEASSQYQWMSIADGELLSAENIADAVAYDESEDNTIEDVDVANVTITRTIKADYNTVVLPFDLTSNQVEAAFGTGTEVFAFSETGEENAEDITINFNKVVAGTISANVPVLVKATVASTEQEFNGVQVVAPTEGAIVEGTNASFIGVFGPTTIDKGHFFVGNGAIYKSAGSTSINAFRAYIRLANPNTSAEVKLFIDGLATRLSEINGAAENGAVYNLAGQRVNKAQKGIFIQNGKKVVK